MRKLRVSGDWRPTQRSLIWAWMVWAGMNMLTVWGTTLLGFSEPSGGINLYPAASVLGRVLLSINIMMLIVFVSLLSGIRMNKDCPYPQLHPFVTQEFWVGVSSVLIVASSIVL